MQQEQVTGSLTGYGGGRKVFGDVVLKPKCEGLVGIRQKLAVLKNTKSTSPGKGEPIFRSLLPSKIQGIGETKPFTWGVPPKVFTSATPCNLK